MPRILDLYSGMGGLSLGFALALEGAEILGLDVDRDAVATYNLNLRQLGATAKVQDVLRWELGGEFDVVIGGPPCQPFSLAVNPKYGKVGRSHPLYPTLPRFFDVVLELKPKAFLMENVKGLITARHRPLLEEQLRRVEPYYNIKWQILNAAYYGVPQRRERLFVLGVRRDLGIRPSFPPQTHAEEERVTLMGRLFRWVTVREAIGDLTFDTMLVPAFLPPETVARILASGVGLRVHELDRPAKTIKGVTGGPQNAEPYLEVPATMVQDDPRFWPLGHHDPREAYYRRLTVRECLRLMGFPDRWIFPESVSVSKKYRLVGEAVCPPLAYRLAVHVGRLMEWEVREPPKSEDWGLPYFRRLFQDYTL